MRESERGRECEGEIEEVWFSSTLTATAVTSLHLSLLSLYFPLLFSPSFLSLSLTSFYLDNMSN